MAFVETPRFPESISVGSTFGPRYSTSKAINIGGYEASNQNWTMPLYEGDVSKGVKSQALLNELLAYFHGVAGMHKGFRFKNYNDYTVTGSQGTLVVISANTTWQLYKTYTFGALTMARKITKPVTGVAFAGGGTYSLDTATGIVTRSAGANPTSWTGEFDTPVRFNVDHMLPAWLAFELYDWTSIPIKEIRI